MEAKAKIRHIANSLYQLTEEEWDSFAGIINEMDQAFARYRALEARPLGWTHQEVLSRTELIGLKRQAEIKVQELTQKRLDNLHNVTAIKEEARLCGASTRYFVWGVTDVSHKMLAAGNERLVRVAQWYREHL